MDTRNRTVHRLAVSGMLGVAAIVLTACSGGGDDGEAGAGAAPADSTVSAAEVDGRSVLVNSDGDPLYISDEEQANDEVLCVSDGCLAFWEPLTISGSSPTGDVSGELGVVERPDGENQVTLDGDPLYTFSEDSSGQINGDGLADTFDGQTLTWHVVATDASDTGDTGDPGGGFDY
jgi:predicted lipoprotein with Yx(FWY)xxD motif